MCTFATRGSADKLDSQMEGSGAGGMSWLKLRRKASYDTPTRSGAQKWLQGVPSDNCPDRITAWVPRKAVRLAILAGHRSLSTVHCRAAIAVFAAASLSNSCVAWDRVELR